MTTLRDFLLALVLPLASNVAYADSTTVSLPVDVVQSRVISFQSNSDQPGLRQEQTFCLPREQQLVKVVNWNVIRSNSDSTIDIKSDPASNCIYVSATISPDSKICTKIPSPTFLEPFRVQDYCTSIPTELQISINYIVRNIVSVVPRLSSQNEEGKFVALQNTLQNTGFTLLAPQFTNSPIAANEITFCTPQQQQAASALRDLLESANWNAIDVHQRDGCEGGTADSVMVFSIQSGT
jgi:hypothetical protein